MVRIPRKLERSGVFLAMACAGILFRTSGIAFAEGTPSNKPASSPASPLESEQATAFQSGYVQAFPEPASGMVIGAREAKRLYGQGDSLYLRLAPTTDAKAGDRFTIFRPTA
ncbi:MAG: hypothetical protein AABY77_06030, partial [Nitrospirota bacterium]